MLCSGYYKNDYKELVRKISNELREAILQQYFARREELKIKKLDL